MNYKSILIILSFCAISFALFFLKSSAYPFNSMDSYFFLNFINGIITSLPATPPLAVWIFSILPSNIIFLKLITFCVLVITMFIFCKTAENYAKDYWWLALALFLSSTIFMQVFYTLEDDLFAFPLIALCFYFISLYHKHAMNKYIIYSLISLALAGMIWKFSIFFILLFLFWTRFNKWYILASILSIPFLPKLIKSLIPSFQVIENIPGLALYSLFTGCMFLLYLRIVNNPVKKFMPTIWLATVLMILNTKFVFLAVPVFILVFVQAYKKIPTKLKYLVVLSIIIIFIAGTIINSTAIPNKHTKELFDVAQSKQVQDYPGSEINCSWDFGYYYQFYFKKDYPVFGHVQPTIKKGIVITNKFEKINECTILYTNKQGKVWNCN